MKPLAVSDAGVVNKHINRSALISRHGCGFCMALRSALSLFKRGPRRLQFCLQRRIPASPLCGQKQQGRRTHLRYHC
jgi:hypothetical protein